MQPDRRPLRERLEITGIAPGGHGIAHVLRAGERRAVFVPRAAPGDILEAEVDFTRKPARASSIRLLQPSVMRGDQPCPIAERCGGCDFMHLSLTAQREVHRNLLEAALERAMRSARPEIDPALPPIQVFAAPSDAGYRSRARLSVTAGRGRAIVGYRRASSRSIEDVGRCHVLDPRLDPVLGDLRELLIGETGEGEAAVALGSEGRLVIDLAWKGELSGRFYASLSERIDRRVWAGAEVWLAGAREPARFGDPRVLTLGADGEALIVPPRSFAQANAEMNQMLGQRVLASALPHDPARESPVVELFAGSGNFTVLLARHTPSLVAVEADPRAIAASRANLAARGLRARLVEGDAESFDLPPGTRTVVLDPPRAGAPESAKRIAHSRVRRIVYVSCDPATLARDMATLAAGRFRLVHLEMFEMFPHTSHVEVLAVLDRIDTVRSSAGATRQPSGSGVA